jgi:hypothetical protein
VSKKVLAKHVKHIKIKITTGEDEYLFLLIMTIITLKSPVVSVCTTYFNNP